MSTQTVKSKHICKWTVHRSTDVGEIFCGYFFTRKVAKQMAEAYQAMEDERRRFGPKALRNDPAAYDSFYVKRYKRPSK